MYLAASLLTINGYVSSRHVCVTRRGYKIAKPTFHLTIRLEERE